MGMVFTLLFVSRYCFNAVARYVLPEPGRPIMSIFCAFIEDFPLLGYLLELNASDILKDSGRRLQSL
jgi:hypothetical protein